MIPVAILDSSEYNYVTLPIDCRANQELLDLAFKTPIGENVPHRQGIVIQKDAEKVSILTIGTYITKSNILKGELGEQLIEDGIITGIVVKAKDNDGHYTIKYNNQGLCEYGEYFYRKDCCPHCGRII